LLLELAVDVNAHEVLGLVLHLFQQHILFHYDLELDQLLELR